MCQICLTHSGFRYLDHPRAVLMPSPAPGQVPTVREKRPLIIHLTVTGRCHARCVGCVNSAISLGLKEDRDRVITAPDMDPRRDAQAVLHLAARAPDREVVLCFYGGEPLLAAHRMARLMEILEASPLRDRLRYMLITNGELLTRSLTDHPRLASSLWLTAVSIDGREAQHNRFRRGTRLARIHACLEHFAPRRTGQVLMWSTLREEQSLWDCFLEFQEVRSRGWAEHFFWHWAESPHPYNNLPDYLERYQEDLHQVMEAYLSALAEGDLLSLVHINELISYFLTGRARGSSACGVELATNYDLAGGKVYPCADLPPHVALGEITADGDLKWREQDLNFLVAYKDRLGCQTCGVHPYCGGRCPVQAATGDFHLLSQYCALMRLHVAVVLQYLPECRRLLARHAISPQTLYDASAYFAQFTDVTP
jgi:radical SAM protein with 4Fe4S-binding SPASM domain